MPERSTEQLAEQAADGLLGALVDAARPWLIRVFRAVFRSETDDEQGDDMDRMAAEWLASHRVRQRRSHG